MPKKHKIEAINETTLTMGVPGNENGIKGYEIIHRDQDGNLHSHIMPNYTFEARAIEYGLDPVADFDKIFDMVLHEPFVTEDDDDDPAEEHGYITYINGKRTRANLFTAETVQDAREVHLLRVDKAKKKKTAVTDPDNHREKIRGKLAGSAMKTGLRSFSSGPVHPVLADLAERVAQERELIRGRGDGKPLKGKKNG